MGHALDANAAMAASGHHAAPLSLPLPLTADPAPPTEQVLPGKESVAHEESSSASDAAGPAPAGWRRHNPEGTQREEAGFPGVHLPPINTGKARGGKREDEVRLSSEKGAWTAVTTSSAASSDIVEVSENCAPLYLPGESGSALAQAQVHKPRPQRLQLEEGCTLSGKRRAERAPHLAPGEEVEYALVEGKAEEVNRGRSHEPGELEDGYPPQSFEE